jgi:hypothetical protein
MTDAFDGIRLKRKRGWEHLNALEAEMDAFLTRDDPRPYGVQIDFNRQTSILTISVKVETAPDPMWGVRIGEILHNFRSALDHLAFELYVISNRKRRPSKTDKIKFPIYWDAKGFDKRGRDQYLKNIRSNAVQLIRAEQPFPIQDGGTGEEAHSPLWHLKELNDWDKHRTLHVTGTLLESFRFTFPPVTYTGTVERDIRQAGPIHQDTILARAHFPGRHEWPFADTEVKCQLLPRIAFDEGTPTVGGWLVDGTLIHIANRTDRILQRIAREVFDIEL